MGLIDVLLRIQQRETRAPLAASVVSEMHELADTYHIDNDPGWLLPIFEAVEQGREIFPSVFFERENSDAYSFLVEVSELLKWKAEFEGEHELIEFPELGWRIYISNESHSPITGRGGSEYQVTHL